jgi:sialate O-acetylesterase
MEMAVGNVLDKDTEIATSDHPQIRMFIVAKKPAQEPQILCKGDWYVCSPTTVGRFSATAYFFGREINKQLDVPVGLVHSSWGGTPIQTWIGMDTLESVPELAPTAERLKKAIATYDPEVAQQKYEKALADWTKAREEATDEAQRVALNGRKPTRMQDPKLSANSAARLYNGMIAPLAPYGIRGALWYQGESNAGDKLYGLMLRTMIAEWRTLWNEGDFPFLFVQLPNYMAPQVSPSESVSGWMRSREQFVQTLAVPKTGMAITIDIGDAKDIHPKNKQEVGRRLAQWALNKTYGKDVVPSGPLYKSMRIEDGKVILTFDYLGGGLAARDNAKLKGFAIAGEDKKFVWADAQIVGDTVVVSSAEVASPVAVRYAWANNPDCNLINKAELPASPFRTDEWDN